MAVTLLTNIKLLAGVRKETSLLRGKELGILPCIENAYMVIEDDRISEYGRMEEIKDLRSKIKNQVDVDGQSVLPAWCDSHTHLVFAASREDEFVDKLKGKSYAEIAAK